MKDEFIRINIAFIPPAEAADVVMESSKEIGTKNEAYFNIDGLNFYPHITIYSPEYPIYNLEKILDTTERLSEKLFPARFVFNDVGTEQGFVGIKFDYSEEIKNIHEAIVNKLNPLRENHIREKYIASYKMEFSDEKKENIKKYGYPSSMSLYHPHMTITRLKNEETAEKIAKEINWPIKEFIVDKIGIFKMGKHGTCVELIKEFKLKQDSLPSK